MEEKNKKEEEKSNWFENYDKPLDTKDMLPIFEMKLAPGQLSRKEKVMFLNNGKEGKTKFGDTINFTVNNNKVDKIWFVKRNQYSLLNAIAVERKKGDLEGKMATVERVGQKTDTRWAITFE